MIQTPNVPINCRQGKRAESAASQVWLLMLMLQTLRRWLAELRLNWIRLLPDWMLMLMSFETVSKHLSWLSLFAAAQVE